MIFLLLFRNFFQIWIDYDVISKSLLCKYIFVMNDQHNKIFESMIPSGFYVYIKEHLF